MANFLKAINEANLSVTATSNGSRFIGDGQRGAHGWTAMDREEHTDTRSDRSGYGRGRSSGYGRRGRGRSRGGGRYNNQHDGRYNDRRGRGYSGVTPYSRLEQGADEDGDDTMIAPQSSYRYNPYGGGRSNNRNSIRGNRGNRQDYNPPMDSKWFKISVPGGKSHEKNWLTSKLRALVTDPFEIVEFHYMGDTACFFVDDKNVADALKGKSHRITCRDGSKIAIHVRPSNPPRNSGRSSGPIDPPPKPLDAETKQILLNCLVERFVESTNSVNLSKMAEDSVLTGNNVQGNLTKPWLMSGFIDVIHSNCPGLVGLDLSNNRIRNLDILRILPEKLPQLEILSLRDNDIRTIDELEKIKNIKSLKHLLISGNPVCVKYQSNPESLKRDIRSKLATVEILDGVNLPPPIMFDVPSSISLPPSKEHYVPNNEVQQRIIQFLTQYFQHYDSDDRQGLLELYHDQAVLSMCINSNVYSKDGRERPQTLNEYFPFSRNLKRLRDKGKRCTLIKSTKLAAVVFLSELPRTKHDLQSFALDVAIELPTFLSFTVRGNFLEGDARDVPRAFSRTFILNGMKVMNDQLHIRNPCARKPILPQVVQNQTPQVVQNQAPQVVQNQTPQVVQNQMTQLQKQELVKKFSEASKMNLEFSELCLGQNGWVFEKAGQNFTSLQSEGKIPAKAFVL